MPKLKPNRGAAKRFTRTAGGGFKRQHANKNHILTKKSPKRIRQLRKAGLVEARDAASVTHMSPSAFLRCDW